MGKLAGVRRWWNRRCVNMSCEIDRCESGEVGRCMEDYDQRVTKRCVIRWEKIKRKISIRKKVISSCNFHLRFPGCVEGI